VRLFQIDLKLYSKIASLTSRSEGARDLARQAQASDLIIFDFDEEVNRFLPAIGFPQTLRGGKLWTEFLKTCESLGEATAELSFPPTNSVVKVIGRKISGCIFALANGNLEKFGTSAELELLAANLCTVLGAERDAKKFEGQTQTLTELTRDLRTYAEALNSAKFDLNRALQETELAKVTAENANATKSAFLANMSHEIRTPLGAILGFSELLKDLNLSHDDRSQFIETIIRNVHSLTRIIDDILDLAKVESGKLDVEEIEFSLFDLMNEAMDLFREKAKQKGIFLIQSVEENVPSSLFSDPTRLRQILINVIGNAVKFTDKGGVKVILRAGGDIEGPLTVQIEVKDTGRGLTEEQRDRLFQPFMQADNSTTRQFGGTGLGLALSKRLAEALGGTIKFGECAPQKGCTFIITFVATASKNESVKSSNGFPQSTAPKKVLPLENIKVLLVDDSVENQYLVRKLLEKNGARVEVASDGGEAVRRAFSNSFDVVLMDIQMPKMDGYEAIRELKENGYTVPVIALTAHAMVEERVKTKAAGFAAHLTKPLDNEEVIHTVGLMARQAPGSLR
jgi:signal transduction histidine kinase/CheY-like chemotaxis protein